jgi:integrase/recombinase XerD
MAALNNEELITRFIDYVTIEKGLSANTIESYRSDLGKFAGYRAGSLLDTRKENIERYMGKLLADGIEGRSVARKVSSIRQFFRWGLIDRLLTSDPTATIRPPKSWKVLPKALSSTEIDAVLNHSTNYARLGNYLVRRDQALLELLYAAGLRVSELTGARLVDLNLQDRLLLVSGKGDKERIVPFGNPATEAIRLYLPMRPVLTQGKASPWLFVGSRGQQLTRMRVWQIVKEHSERKASPHMLRHTCATLMLDNRADLRTVQTLLGHADIGTTQLYTHVAQAQVKAVYMAHHPRAHVNEQQLKLLEIGANPSTLVPGPIICAHCMNPVCPESKWYCAEHLRLNREVGKRLHARRKAGGLCLKCPTPICEGSTIFCAEHLRLSREANQNAYRKAHPHPRKEITAEYQAQPRRIA